MFRKLLVGIFLTANIAALILLWGCCAITWIDPSLCPRLAVMCLAFPLILLFNLLFIPFWLVFKIRLLLVPVVGILLCTGFILDYFPLNYGKHDGDSDLTVMSWNVMRFSYKDVGERLDEVLEYLNKVDADVMCFQECDRVAAAMYVQQHLTDAGYYWSEKNGRTIYSRYPIIWDDVLQVESYITNGINVYHLLVGTDTVAVVNTHLESNFLTKEDRYDGKMALMSRNEEELKNKGEFIYRKLSDSQRTRGIQVDTITNALDHWLVNVSTILCGDFNDTPISYAYQHVGRRMENAYRNKGFGVGVSYNERYFFFRIDHLFHTSDWETVSAHIDNTFLASDHYPLIVKLRKR